jgi:hypothetical protein
VWEERHSFVKETDCEKVCSKCGNREATHQWKTLARPSVWLGSSFWSVALQNRILSGRLPQNFPGCLCQRCLAVNPEGTHECISSWESHADNTFYITKCTHCGTICEKLTKEECKKRDEEEDRRRYEQAVNEDEGIFG